MRRGRFRGKFPKFYDWMFICPGNCRICTRFFYDKCCNYFVLPPPGSGFYIKY